MKINNMAEKKNNKALRKHLELIKTSLEKNKETIEQLQLDNEFYESEIKTLLGLIHENSE